MTTRRTRQTNVHVRRAGGIRDAENEQIRRALIRKRAAVIRTFFAAPRIGLLKIGRAEARLGRPLFRGSALGRLAGSGIRGLGGMAGGMGMT
jgi:hypothetical protein